MANKDKKTLDRLVRAKKLEDRATLEEVLGIGALIGFAGATIYLILYPEHFSGSFNILYWMIAEMSLFSSGTYFCLDSIQKRYEARLARLFG
jgi:hypothetical protein